MCMAPLVGRVHTHLTFSIRSCLLESNGLPFIQRYAGSDARNTAVPDPAWVAQAEALQRTIRTVGARDQNPLQALLLWMVRTTS